MKLNKILKLRNTTKYFYIILQIPRHKLFIKINQQTEEYRCHIPSEAQIRSVDVHNYTHRGSQIRSNKLQLGQKRIFSQGFPCFGIDDRVEHPQWGSGAHTHYHPCSIDKITPFGANYCMGIVLDERLQKINFIHLDILSAWWVFKLILHSKWYYQNVIFPTDIYLPASR